VEFDGLATVAGKQLNIKIGERSGPGRSVGTTTKIVGWVRAFTHPPAGSLWTRQDPCIGVQLRPDAPAGPTWDCCAIGSDHSLPGGGSGYRLAYGEGGRRKGAPGGQFSGLVLTLGVAPLATDGGGGYFPACSEVPSRMRGMAVESVSPRLLSIMLRIEVLLAQASLNPNHGDEGELSHYRRLDENPHAVAAFLKWVGGGAAAWYQHQGVRRLRDICKAGAALHGRSGQ
jgi:hypothetical protein